MSTFKQSHIVKLLENMVFRFVFPLLVVLSVAAAASNDQCSYSVFRDCKAGDADVRSNKLIDSINVIKLAETKRVASNLKGYGGGDDDDDEDTDDIDATALCPCNCSKCPRPLKAQDKDQDDDECLCACGTCGKLPSNNKNKLPSVVPLDCGLKCDIISEYTQSSSSYGAN